VVRPLAALLSALFTVLAFPKASIPYFGLVSLVPLLLAIRTVKPKHAFLLGWLMGAGTNIAGFYWISHTLTEFAGLPPYVAWIGVLLNGLYSGLLFGLWALGERIFQARFDLPSIVHGPALMATLEWLFPLLFPWYLGDSQYNFLPLAQSAEVGGIILVTFLLVLFNCAVFDLINGLFQGSVRKNLLKYLPSLIAILTVAVASIGGWARMRSLETVISKAEKMKIGLIQVNVNHWDKMNPSKYRSILDKFMDLTHTATHDIGVDLVIWPETAVAFQIDLDDMKTPFWALSFDRPLITGGLSCKGISCVKLTQPYYNSAFLFKPGFPLVGGVYHKNYPMLFSEYIPFGEDLPFIYKWFPYAGRFSRGKTTTVFKIRDWRIGPMICYEDIIPRFGLALAKHSPDVFVNLTNDSWFGNTAEPYQHMALAVFRSIEHRKSLVRSTNTGISCFIDPLGRIRKTSKLFTTQILVDSVPKMRIETIYSKYGDFVPIISLIFIVVLILLIVIETRSKGALTDRIESRKTARKKDHT